MSQHNLQAAISFLEVSTTAIDRQSEALRRQRQHLDSLLRQRQTREANHRSRARRLASQNLALAVEESNQALASQLQELEEGLQGLINQTASSAAAYLHHDDSYLQHLADMSVRETDEGEEMMVKVGKLTARLSGLTREEIECRLDRVYLHELREKDTNRMHEQCELGEEELEEDLKSLHIEIPDVAAMSAFQEFKAPLLRAIAELQYLKNKKACNVLEEINRCMTVLLEKAATCVSRLEALQSYQDAVSAYRADFNALAQRHESEMDAAKHDSNPRAEAISGTMQDVLTHWNIPTPEYGLAEHALLARKGRLKQLVHRSRTTVDDSVRRLLEDLPISSERLLQTESGAKSHILRLEQDMQELRNVMDRLELTRIDEDKESGPKARFLARWTEIE